MSQADVACVVMAGGKGERLWPLVRAQMPKVCVSVDGRQTLLETTLRRLAPLAPEANTVVVTIASQAKPVRAVLAAARLRPTVLVEPQANNTAVCIAVAATTLAGQDPHRVMVVVPADHWIKPASAFQRAMKAAIALAQRREEMVTIGVLPRRIHPGLGHLCVGRALSASHGCRAFQLRRYVEKPSWRLARRLTRSGSTYWSAGMFVGRVTVFLELIQRWLPEHARWLFPLGALSGAAFARQARLAYRRVPSVSFDNGVMSHLRRGVVVKGTFAWEDLGSWESWAKVSARVKPALSVGGRHVRVVNGDPLTPPSVRRSCSGLRGHLVATVGLEDVVVVRTADATLICQADEAQAVKALTTRLARDARLARWLS